MLNLFFSGLSTFLLACLKEITGLLKILLIFLGVFVCLVLIVPISPFIMIYFLSDRKKKHIELMNGKRKSKDKGTSLLKLASVNEWANK